MVSQILQPRYAGCKITPDGSGHVTIPNNETQISENDFRDCTSLKSVTILISVTSIYNNAFRGCTSLKSVIIPNSVTKILGNAFFGCTSLESVDISATSLCYIVVHF